ncbi:MAG: Aldehyde dehydrogenase, partial [uncultured Rubrobacteraceae bacterium]
GTKRTAVRRQPGDRREHRGDPDDGPPGAGRDGPEGEARFRGVARLSGARQGRGLSRDLRGAARPRGRARPDHDRRGRQAFYREPGRGDVGGGLLRLLRRDRTRQCRLPSRPHRAPAARHGHKGARRHRRLHRPLELPAAARRLEGRPGAGRRQRRHPQALRGDPARDAADDGANGGAAGGTLPGGLRGRGRGRGARAASRRGHGGLHGQPGDGPQGRRHGRRTPDAGEPRARGQGPLYSLRRRGRGDSGPGRRLGRVPQCRAGLHLLRALLRGQEGRRRLRGGVQRVRGVAQHRRPDGREDGHRAHDQREGPGEGRGPRGPGPPKGREARHRRRAPRRAGLLLPPYRPYGRRAVHEGDERRDLRARAASRRGGLPGRGHRARKLGAVRAGGERVHAGLREDAQVRQGHPGRDGLDQRPTHRQRRRPLRRLRRERHRQGAGPGGPRGLPGVQARPHRPEGREEGVVVPVRQGRRAGTEGDV